MLVENENVLENELKMLGLETLVCLLLYSLKCMDGLLLNEECCLQLFLSYLVPTLDMVSASVLLVVVLVDVST